MSFLFSKNKKQLEAIFNWLSGVVNQDDLILLEREEKRECYYFEFPLKFGDKPRKIKTLDIDDCTFWVRFSSGGIVPEKNEWCLIFQSPELEIYESKKRFEGKQFKPLHWGLNDEEKKISLKIARKSLEIFLKDGKKPHFEDLDIFLPKIFNLRADLDVALWVNGALRGSFVGENKILSDGFIEAAIGASRDSRFKPLDFEELAFTRIEITLFSDLRVPLSENLIKKNEILYNKGYLLKKGEKRGWFLPEVFNVIKFKDLKEFLFRLASEKAALSPQVIFDKRTEIYIFEVEDFIEGIRQQEQVFDLSGPIIKQKENIKLEESAVLAADWLLNVQEADGNFIPIINPLTGKCSQIDWPRLAFVGWSLVEFGKTIKRNDYLKAGEKSFNFLKQYLLKERTLLNDYSKTSLTLAYLGQLSLSLNYRTEAAQCGKEISQKVNQLIFEPILFQQLGSFFIELTTIDKDFWGAALRFAQISKEFFENNLKNKVNMDLASWAELANLYLKIFRFSGDFSSWETAKKIIDWLLKYQLESGAFVSNPRSNFVYTRGSGKIAEVLAAFVSFGKLKKVDTNFDLNYYEECLFKVFNWLKTTQYLEQSTYSVSSQIEKNKVIGGFRHDYFNPELWIDSAGHFILAASRFLNSKN